MKRAHLLLVLLLVLAFVLPVSPASAEVAPVLLDVPWRSQIDGSPSQRHNSGLAALAMVFAAFGAEVETAGLRTAHDRLAGEDNAPVSAASLVDLAEHHDFLVWPVIPSSDDALPAVAHQIENGFPVLLYLGDGVPAIPGHWVVASGILEDGRLLCEDPAAPLAVYGRHRILSGAEEKAWLANGAVSLAVGQRAGEEAQTATTRDEETDDLIAAGDEGSPYWWSLVEVYARWFDLDPFYLAAVMVAESGGKPDAVGDQGHSVGLMQLHDEGFGAGLGDLRFDPALNLWHGAKVLAAGMQRYGDPFLAYSRYYNPDGVTQGERVMAIYAWLLSLGAQDDRPTSVNAN